MFDTKTTSNENKAKQKKTCDEKWNEDRKFPMYYFFVELCFNFHNFNYYTNFNSMREREREMREANRQQQQYTETETDNKTKPTKLYDFFFV